LRDQITNIRSALSVSSLSKHGAVTELEDLLRTRTELECVIADLELSGEKGETQRATIQQELHNVQTRIKDVEAELLEVVPLWEGRVRAEKEEQARYLARLDYFPHSTIQSPSQLRPRSSTTRRALRKAGSNFALHFTIRPRHIPQKGDRRHRCLRDVPSGTDFCVARRAWRHGGPLERVCR
jgi:hypothetical protein